MSRVGIDPAHISLHGQCSEAAVEVMEVFVRGGGEI